MTKLNLLCPIMRRPCKDCSLYRGRHSSLPFCRYYRSHTNDSAKPIEKPLDAESFNELISMAEPWKNRPTLSGSSMSSANGADIKVIDMESGETRYCRLEELKTWNWKDPEQMRLIDGRQVTSWEQLAEMVSYMKEEGRDEIELYDGPRFMLLGGG